MTTVTILGPEASSAVLSSQLQGKAAWDVLCLDVSPKVDDQLLGSALVDRVKRSRFVVITGQDSSSVDRLLGKDGGILEVLEQSSVLLIDAPVTSTLYDALSASLIKEGRGDIQVVDFHLSKGGKSSEDADLLSIWASGSPEALEVSESLLKDIAPVVHVITGGLGSTSKLRLVSQLLYGVHLVTAAEATGLAQKAGIDGWEAYKIIKNAAGGSTAYETHVPSMINRDWSSSGLLEALLEDLGLAISTARTLQVPLPLASAAEQACISSLSQGYGSKGQAELVRLFQPLQAPDGTSTPVGSADSSADGLESLTPPAEVSKVGFVGLGAMGQGMARSIVTRGFSVQGYDTYPPSTEKFASFHADNNSIGKATAAASPAEAAKEAEVFVIVVQNAAQVSDVLFGAGRAADALPYGATIILSSTVPPSFSRDLEHRLDALGRGLKLVDAPVSGGVARAANGDLTIICSGSPSALHATHSSLLAMSGKESNIYCVKGGVGAASSVKLVNQLLAGVHIAASAEAMALAAHLGLNTRQVFDIFRQSSAWSWMFENRVPQMLNADWTPHSALAIFVKDLGIVLDEAKRLRAFTPISSISHALYLDGAARGWTREADAGIVRFWEEDTGVSVHQSAS